MKILLIGNDLDTPQMRAVLAAEGCSAQFLPSHGFDQLSKDMLLAADAALVARDHGDHEPFEPGKRLSPIPLIAAIGAENIAAGISSLNAEENALCNAYILSGGEENLRRLARFSNISAMACRSHRRRRLYRSTASTRFPVRCIKMRLRILKNARQVMPLMWAC